MHPSMGSATGPDVVRAALLAENLFFQLVSSRYEHASLILTSNLPFGKAHMFARICA